MNVGSIPWNADTLAGVSGLQEQEKWGLCVISNIPNLTQDQINQLTDISAVDPGIISALVNVSVPNGVKDNQLRAVVNSFGGLVVSDIGLVARKRFAGNQDYIKTIYAPNKQVSINNVPSEILCLYGLNKTAIVQSIYSKFTEIDCAYLEVIAELKKVTMPQLARLTSGVYSTANLSARIRAMDLAGDCGGTAYKSTEPPTGGGGGGGGGGGSILGTGNYPQVTTWDNETGLIGDYAFIYKYGTLDLAPRTAPSSPTHPPDAGQAIPYLQRWVEKPYPDTGTVFSKVEVGGSFLIGKYQDPTSVNTSNFIEDAAEGTKITAPATLHTVTDPVIQQLAWRPNAINSTLPSRIKVKSYAANGIESETAPAKFRDRTIGNTIWTSGHKWYAFQTDVADLSTTPYLIGSIKLWFASPVPNTMGYYRCGGVRIYSNLFNISKTLLCEYPVRYQLIEPIAPNGGTCLTIPLNFRIDNSFVTYIVINNEDKDVYLGMLQPTGGLSAYWVSNTGTYWTPVIIS